MIVCKQNMAKLPNPSVARDNCSYKYHLATVEIGNPADNDHPSTQTRHTSKSHLCVLAREKHFFYGMVGGNWLPNNISQGLDSTDNSTPHQHNMPIFIIINK